MKALQVLVLIGGVALMGVGSLMTVTNPGQNDYEDYATETLTGYLKKEVCTQAPLDLGGLLQNYCKTLVDTGRPQIQQIIARATRRHNYLLFSIYETQLSFPSPVPSYQFETIGAFAQFYTYEAERL